MTHRELVSRLEDEYEELVQKGIATANESNNEPYKYFLDHAYEFAIYNEIVSFFTDTMEEDDFNENWRERFKKVPSNKNILGSIYNDWLNYNHPEYYNVFSYEGLIDIINYWLDKQLKN